MCGIIGYTGRGNAVTVVLEGLRRLEYRGYDSAGVAYETESGIEIKRKKGKINDLMALFSSNIPISHTAIGHTRWATHGKPSDENAHPHSSGGIAVVHNGIIENCLELKKELSKDGYVFTSETDTEVIAHLIHSHSKKGLALEDAVRAAFSVVRGAYAVAVISEKEPGKIVGVRKDSPLVCGLSEGEYFLASDIPAFLNYSKKAVFIEDGEMVIMTPEGIEFYGMDRKRHPKTSVNITWDASMAEKSGYRHFMLKEIHEQPRAIADTIAGRFNPETGEVNIGEFGLSEDVLTTIAGVTISACGTSYHAGLIGKYMIESIARLPVEVDIASEFRYREPIINDRRLFVSITQSGETADTLAAQRLAKKLGAHVLSICNVIGSTSAREADSIFYTRSGPEIGVASTKAFTTQIVALYLLAVLLAKSRKQITAQKSKELLADLLALPDAVENTLKSEQTAEEIAKRFFKKSDFLFLGRGINYPIALEGALKLKEISYIHAEGYPAGELKHGPIALIDEEIPVVFIVQNGELREKLISNMHEVKSRGGKIIALTDSAVEEQSEVFALSEHTLSVPASNRFLGSVLFVVPLQLMAYYIGVLRGCDVDQPRNLAKSVTVE